MKVYIGESHHKQAKNKKRGGRIRKKRKSFKFNEELGVVESHSGFFPLENLTLVFEGTRLEEGELLIMSMMGGVVTICFPTTTSEDLQF